MAAPSSAGLPAGDVGDSATRVLMRVVPEAWMAERLEVQADCQRPVLHLYTFDAVVDAAVHDCSHCSRRVDALGAFGVEMQRLR